MIRDIKQRYDQNFYKIMAENFGDEIFVTDGEGVVLFVNCAAVNVIGKAVTDIVGRNVAELVEEGMFQPSVTQEVIKRQTEVSLIQTLSDGSHVLCTGVPVFDPAHEKIKMIVSTTKNVEALQELMEEIDQQKGEIENLREQAFEEQGLITGKDGATDLKNMILKIAPLDIPILIQGETGVGKEVAAKAIHQFGMGSKAPFIKINCATIPENLIESELFGYERGAFTGAEKSGKKGKVEMAAGGTLFLDEIGEMPLSLQVKLLDFLQDGSFSRVGGTARKTVKTRIITATNRNLNKMSEEGTFRSDLYYRINGIPFVIPPLRARISDIEALARYFIARCNSKYNGKKHLDDKAMILLKGYSWPGNVRELEHMIEQVYVLSEGTTITEKDLRPALSNGIANVAGKGVTCEGLMPLKEAKWEVERILVNRAYAELGSTYKVAEVLKCDQSTVVKLMKKHNPSGGGVEDIICWEL